MAKQRSEKETVKILKEAKTRFNRVEAYEADARAHVLNDTKFAEGDSDNNWQWPDDIRLPRETDQRPMLTINKTRQHNLDVLNDARQSKVGVKIIPTGGEATYESAQAYMGVVRSIEYRSNADTAYQTALKGAVQGGIGYWRILTDYVDDDSFDMEILIKRVKDFSLIYLDPDIQEFDGSDANWGFVATDVAKDTFDKNYPKWKGRIQNATTFGDLTWVDENRVRIAEYWRRVPVEDKLVGYLNPLTGERQVGRLSKIPAKIRKAIMEDENTITRDLTGYKVEGFKIIGDEIAEEMDWKGIYIPIVRVVGEETIIDGVLDWKGHTRALKDAQRMFNFNASAFVEHGALQTKVPWIGTAEGFEDYEGEWENANTVNFSFLKYNARDEQGQVLPPPERTPPPSGAPLYLEGMKESAEWMRMVSGQYQADMGAPGNERSGVAIQQRQRQGDNATYHYLDHQALAIRFTGKQLIDLIPKYYDTERVLKYKGEDGTEAEIHIDPRTKAGPGEPPLQAVRTEKMDEDTERTIFNPNVGKYDVEADVGPAYATKRQDALNAGMQILAANKELTAIIGDLILMNADFPGSQEMAQRLKRMVPAQAMDENANPQVVGMQKQMQEMGQFIQVLSQQLKDKAADLDIKAEKNTIDQEKNAISGYDAQTKRLAAVKEALGMDDKMLFALVRAVMLENLSTSSGDTLEPALDVPPAQKELATSVPEGMGGMPAEPPAPPGSAAA